MFESIGQRLKQEREDRFLTLERASAETRIRIVFLQALEADDYSVMPSAAQGRGFLRNYAEYLGLNIDEMIAELQKRAAESAQEVSGPLPQVNLAETEIPSLTSTEDEKPSRSFLSRLGRRPKVDVSTVAESTEPVLEESPVPVTESAPVELPSAPVAEIESIEVVEKPKRGRKKKIVVEEVPLQVETVEIKLEQETPAQVEVTEIKPEELIPSIEENQAEVMEEAKPGLLSRLMGIFQSRSVKTEPEVQSAIETKPQRSTPSQPADIIFAEIGQQLRSRRELISLTFDEVERHTKLRAAFVKALEEGALDRLPSPVQTRGMLANYATFLDLDVDALLLRFADGLQARRHEKYAETPREKIQMEVVTSMPMLRSFIAGDLIFGVVIISVLVALGIWGVGRVVTSQNEASADATAPSIVQVLGSTPLPTSILLDTTATIEGTPAETPTFDPLFTPDAPTPISNANVAVSIFAVERTFARISVDGEVVFEGRFIPGETKLFEAAEQIAILTGNGAGLRVTYNGRDLGLLGNIGEVVSRVYLITGVAEPTATISPTPTVTVPATITPVPSSTPSITPTVTPPDGG